MTGEMLVAQNDNHEVIDCLGVNEEVVVQSVSSEQWSLSNNGTPQACFVTTDPSEVIAPFSADQVFVSEVEASELAIVYVGPPGPTGPSGGGGSGGAVGSYTHTQSSPSQAWVVVHNLNTKPQIKIVVGGLEREGRITYPSLQSALIEFNYALAGEAYCVG